MATALQKVDEILQQWTSEEQQFHDAQAALVSEAVARMAFGVATNDDAALLADAIDEGVITREEIQQKVEALPSLQRQMERINDARKLSGTEVEARERYKTREKEVYAELRRLKLEATRAQHAAHEVRALAGLLAKAALKHPELFEPFDRDQVQAGHDWDSLRLKSLA